MKVSFLVTKDICNENNKINKPEERTEQSLKLYKPSVSYCTWHNHIKKINIMTANITTPAHNKYP
jgi:hypothetical protein